jgi:putative chitinase
MITIEQFQSILPDCPSDRIATCYPCLVKALEEFQITTPLRIAAFIAQTAHESAEYRSVRENLNYSAKGLVGTWPSHFTQEKAAQYARQPEKIANYVYGGHDGNGDEASGDGWRFCGRGYIQVTFRDNYRACSEALKTDLLSAPEQLEQPELAFRSAGWYWTSRKLNDLADRGDFVGITRKINGGLNGQDERQKYYDRAKAVLGA